MSSEAFDRPLPIPAPGLYNIRKYHSKQGEPHDKGAVAESNVVLARGADTTKRQVVVTRPPIDSPGWELKHVLGNRYIMALEGGFASKIGEDNLVYTTDDHHVIQTWELTPALAKGQGVYYIRNAASKQVWMYPEAQTGGNDWVRLEELGDIASPEGLADKFLFVLEPRRPV